jgi:drug/metabolite transporter (DMT)-like permease
MLSSAVVYSIIVMLGWGVSNAALKSVVARFGPLRSIIFRGIVAVPILVISLILARPVLAFSAESLLLGAAIAVAGYFPFMFFSYALKSGKVGIVAPISSGRVVVSALLGFWLLGDVFSFGKLAAVGITLLGVVLASVDFRDIRNSNLLSQESGVPMALLAALSWGVVLPLFKFPSEALGALFFALMVESAVCACAAVHLKARRERIFPQGRADSIALRRNGLFVLLAGLGAGFATVFLNLGYETGEIAIVSAISSASVIISIIAAALFFRERLRVAEYLGAAFVLLGVIVASMM